MKNRMLKLPRSCGVDASLALPVLLGSAGNIGCVVGVVLMNKYMQLAHDFDHLVFLSFCHFAFTALGTRAMLCCRVFRYKAARPAAVAPVALGTLSSVGFMNLNLKHNSVSFYQLSKIACIPLTLFLSWVVEGAVQPPAVVLSLLPLVAGLGVAQVHDYEANATGTAYAAVAVACTVLGQMYTSSCQRALGCDSNQLLYHTAPLIALGALLLCPLFDGVDELRSVDWNDDLKGHIFASCVLALGANVTNYYVLGRTSPLTYQVLTHLKTILTIVGSMIFFGIRTNARNGVGIVVALAGVASYTEVKRRAAVRSAERERRRLRDLPTEASP